MSPHNKRAAELLRAARDFLKKLAADGDDAVGTVVHYDEADCDGYCLLSDLDIHLGLGSHVAPRRGTWEVKVEHPGAINRDKTFHVQRKAEQYRDDMVREGFKVTIDPET